jgi:hypothetical protein
LSVRTITTRVAGLAAPTLPLLLAVAFVVGPAARAGEEAGSPPSRAARATVLVRVSGGTATWGEDPAGAAELQAAGTGFLVTPAGHLLAEAALISGQTLPGAASAGGDPEAMAVTRVEVLLAAEGEEEPALALDAAVEAIDLELGLALLEVELPAGAQSIPFGDSDALEDGQSVTAWTCAAVDDAGEGTDSNEPGFDGPRAKVGRLTGLELDENGAVRGMRTNAITGLDAPVGPLTDRQGYAVGMVTRKWVEDELAAEVVPVNRIKEFLEEHRLAAQFPERLQPGPDSSSPWKGLHLRVVENLTDESPARTRWRDRARGLGLELRIDRLATPLTLDEIESRLLAGAELGGIVAERIRSGRPGEPTRIAKSTMRAHGAAAGVATHFELGLQYLLVKLSGREKLVARYTGPADLLAYNRSVLRQSLDSLHATRLLSLPVDAGVALEFEPVPVGAASSPAVPLPSGWTREALAGEGPPGMAEPDAVLSASPLNDFTVAMRVYWWAEAPAAPEEAARIVANATGGSSGAAAYFHQDVFLDVTRAHQGMFRREGGGLLLLETRAPLERAAFIENLRLEWLSEASR